MTQFTVHDFLPASVYAFDQINRLKICGIHCRTTNKGIEEMEFSTGTLLVIISKNESSHFANGFSYETLFYNFICDFTTYIGGSIYEW